MLAIASQVVGAVLMVAIEYYYQSSQVPVPIIFSSTSSAIISKDSSNIILRSIVRFNFILNIHSFVIIVIIYVVM